MAKIQFNCRLRSDTIRAINKNAAQWGAAEGRKVSQAEVIERTFDGEMIASTHGLSLLLQEQPEQRKGAKRGIRQKGDKTR